MTSGQMLEILELTRISLLPPWAGYRGRYQLVSVDWLSDAIPVVVAIREVLVQDRLYVALRLATQNLPDDELAAMLAYMQLKKKS